MDDATDLPALTTILLAAKATALAMLFVNFVRLRRRTRKILDQIDRLQTAIQAGRCTPSEDRTAQRLRYTLPARWPMAEPGRFIRRD